METKTLNIVEDNTCITDRTAVSAVDAQIREVNNRIDNVSELTNSVSMDLAHTREFVELMSQNCMEEVYNNRELINKHYEDVKRLLSDVGSVKFKMHRARRWIIWLGIAALLYVAASISAIIYLMCQVL